MPKNLLKVDIFEPNKPKDSQISIRHFNGKMNSSPTSYSFHFDSKLMGGSFYIEWEQIPDFILEKTIRYREKLGRKTLYAPSVAELKNEIDALFSAYLRELSEIKYEKKIGLSTYNAFSDSKLSMSIEHIIFYLKIYYDESGNIIEQLNVREKNKYDTKLDVSRYEIYDYTDELLESIVSIQTKLHIGMENFIENIKTKEQILNCFQSSNLLGKATN